MAAYLFGIAALLLFWLFSFATTGDWAPWALAISESTVGPKKLSASKFQALIWTAVTLFAYSSVFGARLLHSGVSVAVASLPTIPLNLLVLMGLSAVTAAGSKSVTISYKARGLIPRESGGLTATPAGEADLAKTQMVVWSLVGAGIYLLSVNQVIRNIAQIGLQVALPDVDGALLVLMGVSEGSYLGNKLVTREVAKKLKLERILPLKGPPGTMLTITGEGFGAEQNGGFVALNQQPIRTKKDGLLSWTDTQVQVIVPATYHAGDKVSVEMYCNGEWSEQRAFEVA